MLINIANKKKRDAKVAMEGVRGTPAYRKIAKDGREPSNIRLLKCDLDRDYGRLLEKYPDLAELGEALAEQDPEIDIETFGKFITETTRVYAVGGKVVFHIREEEVITGPDGTERERRPRKLVLQNINTDVPVPWTGKMISKGEAVRRFVFTGMKQIVHVNGLTRDFLFEIAEELHEKDSLMIIGGGKKGSDPLVFQRGGRGYRGFLEGRIEGESYCLLLHLSNLELKKAE